MTSINVINPKQSHTSLTFSVGSEAANTMEHESNEQSCCFGRTVSRVTKFASKVGCWIQESWFGQKCKSLKDYGISKLTSFKNALSTLVCGQPSTVTLPLEVPVPTHRLTRLTLNFKELGTNQQAKKILQEVDALLKVKPNLPGVALTYSANLDQTKQIIKAYTSDQQEPVRIHGSNQAAVVAKIYKLLNTTQYQHLRSRFQIAPITTMKYVDNKRGPQPVDDSEFESGLKFVEHLCSEGFHFIGWCNQKTCNNPYPFAIGGGVAGTVANPEHLQRAQELFLNIEEIPYLNS